MPDQLDILDEKWVEVVADAIARGRVELVAQGIHAASDPQSLLYNECFARISGPDGRLYGAGEFVPCLETLGKTALLDVQLVELVLDQLQVDSSAVLGCNLSAGSFSSANWGRVIGKLRAHWRLAPRIVFELTETQELTDISGFTEIVAELRDLGCRVALDDFGTGFASPRLLQLADFDIVKIDAAFVSDVWHPANGYNSLWHLVGFASCFAPTIVVEGIETAELAEIARAAGATHLQGYSLSKPQRLLTAAASRMEVSAQ